MGVAAGASDGAAAGAVSVACSAAFSASPDTPLCAAVSSVFSPSARGSPSNSGCRVTKFESSCTKANAQLPEPGGGANASTRVHSSFRMTVYATSLQLFSVASSLTRRAAISKAPPSLGSGLSRSQCSFERQVKGLDGCQLVEMFTLMETGSIAPPGCRTGLMAGGIGVSAREPTAERETQALPSTATATTHTPPTTQLFYPLFALSEFSAAAFFVEEGA